MFVPNGVIIVQFRNKIQTQIENTFLFIAKFKLANPLIFILDFFILGPQSILDPEPHHDGVMFAAAVAVSQGRIPNRDVFAQYGPLAPWLQGLYLHLFGNKLVNLRLMTVLLLSLTAVFMFVLIRKYLGSKISFVIQLAWIVSYPKLPLPPALPWSSVFSTLFLVLAIVAFRSAILNTNTHALIEYKQKRKQTKLIQDMKDEINMLKAEIDKIKNHLNLS